MSYNILDAAKDLITGDLEYADEDTVFWRNEVCKTCDANVAGLCTACSCVIALKTKLKKTECPLELWD